MQETIPNLSLSLSPSFPCYLCLSSPFSPPPPRPSFSLANPVSLSPSPPAPGWSLPPCWLEPEDTDRRLYERCRSMLTFTSRWELMGMSF